MCLANAMGSSRLDFHDLCFISNAGLHDAAFTGIDKFHSFASICQSLSFIHSFWNLYSTSSRKLLRGAPGSSIVKENSFLELIESVRTALPMEEVQCKILPGPTHKMRDFA